MRPNDSAMHAIVDAVPIVMQWPLLRDIALSASWKSAWLMSPQLRIQEQYTNTDVHAHRRYQQAAQQHRKKGSGIK